MRCPGCKRTFASAKALLCHYGARPQCASVAQSSSKRPKTTHDRNTTHVTEFAFTDADDDYEPIWDTQQNIDNPHQYVAAYKGQNITESIECQIADAFVEQYLVERDYFNDLDDIGVCDRDLMILEDLKLLRNPSALHQLQWPTQPHDPTEQPPSTPGPIGDEPPDTNPHTAPNSAFRDNMGGHYTNEEMFCLELLQLIRRARAPNYLYDELMKLFGLRLLGKLNSFSTSFRSRQSTIDHFARRFHLDELAPTLSLHTFNTKEFPLVCHNARAMILSLLLDPELFREENLLFPNPHDPLGDLPPRPSELGDITTGDAFRRGYENTKQKPSDLPIGLTIYMDKLTVDRHGHLCLEPVYFTLSIFNRQTRNKPEAWRSLGYIPNIGLVSPAETRNTFSSQEKTQLYHELLRKILRQYAFLEKTGIPGFRFDYKGRRILCDLKFFVNVVIGDTEAHDRLCGHLQYRQQNAKNVCRQCAVPFDELDNPNAAYPLTCQSDIDSMVLRQELEELASMGQHNILTAWYHSGITFGGNPRGIHGVTPSEPLHQIDLGIFKYLVGVFFADLGKDKCKLHAVVDQWARRIGRYLLHQSDRKLPRTYFPNGISGTTKLAGHEYVGVILVLHIIVTMKGPRDAILADKRTNMTQRKLAKWAELLHLLLCWRAWLKSDSIPRAEVEMSRLAHQRLLAHLNHTAPRLDGTGWKVIKFHMVTHMTNDMLEFGVPGNIDTSAPECNHIVNAKDPCQHTQMRASDVEWQTATRAYENMVLDAASKQLAPCRHSAEDSGGHRPGGSSFRLICTEGYSGDLNALEFEWLSSRSTGCYDDVYLHWVGRHVLSNLGGEGAAVVGYTEYRREQLLLRAHPKYRNHLPWHDFALFDWDIDGQIQAVPAQIIMFLDIPDRLVDHPDLGENVHISEGGLHVLIESLDNPLPDLSRQDQVTIRQSKEVSVPVAGWGTRNRLSQRSVHLVPADTISGAVSAVPDLGGEKGDFIIVHSFEDWRQGFSNFIADGSN